MKKPMNEFMQSGLSNQQIWLKIKMVDVIYISNLGNCI
jgi:hypothetical protein